MNIHHKFIYKVRNFFHRLREFYLGSSAAIGKISCKSELRAVHLRGGKVHRDLGVISRRVVTNAGVDFMATEFFDGSVLISVFNFHASGTGVAAENVTDTTLGTEVATRVAGAKTHPGVGLYRTIATIPYVAGFNITEHGIFSAAAAGTLWDRSVFAAIGVVNGDSIQFTYTLTIVAGG